MTSKSPHLRSYTALGGPKHGAEIPNSNYPRRGGEIRVIMPVAGIFCKREQPELLRMRDDPYVTYELQDFKIRDTERRTTFYVPQGMSEDEVAALVNEYNREELVEQWH